MSDLDSWLWLAIACLLGVLCVMTALDVLRALRKRKARRFWDRAGQ